MALTLTQINGGNWFEIIGNPDDIRDILAYLNQNDVNFEYRSCMNRASDSGIKKWIDGVVNRDWFTGHAGFIIDIKEDEDAALIKLRYC